MKTEVAKQKALVEAIRPLAERLKRINQQAASQGVFTNDRELLACPECSLVEDVTSDGILITYDRRRNNLVDTGLRFVEIEESIFRCPVCRTKLKGVL